MRKQLLAGLMVSGVGLARALGLAAQVALTGAGATFPNPIYTKWFDAYHKQAGVPINYQSIGSGTTYIFVDYLSKVSGEWKAKVGKATSVNWPVGLGGKGNESVTQQVKQTEGAIGYVELIYALANKLPYADVKNASGTFVEPGLGSVREAAASARFDKKTDFRVSITDAPGADAYPIASFTWLLVRPGMKDVRKARALKNFLSWMITPEAQRMASELNYAPVPEPVVAPVRERLQSLRAALAFPHLQRLEQPWRHALFP